MSELNFGEYPAIKSPQKLRKNFFEPLIKKTISRKFTMTFRKKREKNLRALSRKGHGRLSYGCMS